MFVFEWKTRQCINPFPITQHSSSSLDVAVVQSLSRVRLFVTPWTAACQASLSFTISRSLLKLMSIESSMLSNRFILCCLLLLLLSVFPSIRGFGHLMRRWPKYWNFSFNISAPNEYSGFISFRIDWFDLPAVQGTLESSLAPQFKSINSLSLSLLYSPTLTYVHNYWKNLALNICIFVGKVLPLLFNIPSRFVIAFLLRRKCLLNFMAAVTVCSDWGAQEEKIRHSFEFSPFYFPWSNGIRHHDLGMMLLCTHLSVECSLT